MGKNLVRFVFTAFFVSVLLQLLAGSPLYIVKAQSDSDSDGILDSEEKSLAFMYAPYLHFVGGEKFYPTSVLYHVENSALYFRDGDVTRLIDASPTVKSVSSYKSDNYYLKNTLGVYKEIAKDYQEKRKTIGDIVYARVTKSGGYFVIQYWFFYAFNPGKLNQHQGDWEMIQVVLDSDEKPLYAFYSQHFAGEKAIWDDVGKVNGHPEVYVALGSHANYFRPYQGKLGMENDVVGGSVTLKPGDYRIVLLSDSSPWLEYGGRWGDWAEQADIALGAVGPTGPGHGENADKWYNPISWGNKLFSVDQTWFSLSWIVYNSTYIILAIVVALSIIKTGRIVKRKRDGKLNIGKVLRSKAGIGVVLGIAGLAIYLLAMFMPWYVVKGDVQTSALKTIGEVDLALIDGVDGVRINTLQSNGLTGLFGLGIPFSIILLSSVILSFLDIIGIEKPRSLGRKYIRSGIASLIPVVIILTFIAQLSTLVTPLAAMVGDIPPQATKMLDLISSSPISGSYRDTLDSYGTVFLSWGLGIGSYLFVVAAITRFIAGIILGISTSGAEE